MVVMMTQRMVKNQVLAVRMNAVTLFIGMRIPSAAQRNEGRVRIVATGVSKRKPVKNASA